jgi:hypothetical protein
MSAENTNPEKKNWYLFFLYKKKEYSYTDFIEELKKHGAAPAKEFNIEDAPVHTFHFYVLTEEEMKNYKIERADSFALMSVELTEEMVKDFGKGKIEPHKDNLSVMCLNELYKLDKLDVSSCKFFDLNLSNVCY